MSISGIFLLLAFLFGVIAVIVWPLLPAQQAKQAKQGKKAAVQAAPLSNMPEIAQLRSEHEAILIAIRDLDFDYQTGKFTEEDYRTQRETLVQRGVETLRRIDEREAALIEQAVSVRRSTRKV
jgi:hypothetical protein